MELKGALRIVLESDGTEVDDDAVLLDADGPCAGRDVVLILLQIGEKWKREFLQEKPKEGTMSDSLFLLQAIKQHSKELQALIDSEFGLLEELLRHGLLTEKSYEDVRTKPDPFKKNDCLLRYIKLKSTEKDFLDFLDALRVTDQTHIANFLLANGERLDIRYGLERPLGPEELSQLRMSGPYLLAKLLVTEELLGLLYTSKAITDQHKEHINGQRTSCKKITELVNIIRRRSFAAFKVFISVLHETQQSHVADLLSKPGAIVPVHINITEDMPTRDIKAIESDLAVKMNEFYKALINGCTEKYNSLMTDVKELWLQMELSGIRYKGSCQGNSITVFLWCRDSRAMSRLLQMLESGNLEKMLMRTLTFLAVEVLSFSVKINRMEWKLAESYFQVSESQIDYSKPSPFVMLPKELLEIVLIKSLLSFYNSTWKAFPFTDFNPYQAMTSVCSGWWKLITKRHWFQSTVKGYLERYKIVQRNSVLDILPKELMEMILMQSLVSYVRLPWRSSLTPVRYQAFVLMASVRQEWRKLLTSRTWFSSTMRTYLRKNKHLAILQEHHSIFDQCLEVDCAFLWEMNRSSLLEDEQVSQMGSEPDHLKQTEQLFLKVFLRFSAENYAEFCKVLERTSQGHIANYLEANGVIDLPRHDEWPLDDEAKARLDRVQSRLGDFVPPDEFLDALKTINCITKIHAEGISSLPDGQKLNELLRIVRKRSFVAYRQFAAHLRKLDQFADVAQILTADDRSEDANTTDINEENSEVSPNVTSQGKGPDEVPDLKVVELTLAEKLLEVGKRLSEGHSVSVHDMNQIRTLWLTLERLQPEETEEAAEDPEAAEVHGVDNNFLVTDDLSECDETVAMQWTENKNESSDRNDSCNEPSTPVCETTENSDLGNSKPKRAKLLTSQSYAFSKFTWRDMIMLLLRLQLEQSQATRKQKEKSEKGGGDDAKKDDANKTNKSNSSNKMNFSPDSLKELEKYISIVRKHIEANRGNPLIENPNDYPVLYMRSNSVGNFGLCS